MSLSSMTVATAAFTIIISTDVLAHFFGLTLVVNTQGTCGISIGRTQSG